MGLHRAGFEVVGVDIENKTRYPFEFHQADALEYPLDGFDFIWASPPCQAFTYANNMDVRGKHLNLIPPIRERLAKTSAATCIENVPGAPLRADLVLDGTMFPELRVIRRRHFELNFPAPFLLGFPTRNLVAEGWSSVTDGDNSSHVRAARRKRGLPHQDSNAKRARDMGIDWHTNRHDLGEAIPPAFAEFIGLAAIGFDGVNASRGSIAAACVAVSDGWCILFTLAEGVRAWRDDIQAAGGKWDTTLAWIKPDASPRFNGQGAARGFENAVTAWCGKGYRSWNGGGKRGIYTHLVNYGRQGEHPTEKPVPLMAEIIADFTQLGQLICDPFCGSGSTGVAAVRHGRRFIGIEQNERWFDLSCMRIAEAIKQDDLFVQRPKPVKQTSMFSEDLA
jgi:site-specific DNA-methyltransferase (adenine-specific)